MHTPLSPHSAKHQTHEGSLLTIALKIPVGTRHQNAPIPPPPPRSPQTHNMLDVVYVTTQSTPGAIAAPLLDTQSTRARLQPLILKNRRRSRRSGNRNTRPFRLHRTRRLLGRRHMGSILKTS